MSRRSQASGKPIKTSRKTAARKRGNAPKTAVRRSPSARQETELARLTRELQEAQEQQRATSEILGVVARSRTDVRSVLETVCQSAAQLCEAYDATIWRPDGDRLLPAAHHGPITQIESIPLVRGTVLGRSILDKRTVHIADFQTQAAEFPITSEYARRLGFRTGLYVPLMREGVAIGVIALRRAETQLFTERQVALLQTFADQAVIAIENARLLNELRQRTADLSESLEQQTATSEVLKVISSSPGDLKPVFESLLANAKRLCGAKFGTLLLREGSAVRCVAIHGATAEYTEARQRAPVIEPAPDTALGRVLKTKQVIQIADIQKVPGYVANPVQAPLVQLADARSILSVPMLKEKELVGIVEIYRQEVQPFTEKQVALLENFAAQAVIAIENARLLNEFRDSLGRQTATSEVLSVISSSRGNLAPVFHAILENATRICEATFGSMLLRESEGFRRAALHNAPQQFEEFNKNVPIFRRGMASSFDHAIDTGQVSHTLDAAAEEPNAPIARYAGARTLLDVPMLKGNEAIGILGIYRQEVRPFTDRQIELVKNFAAQAVIAIENARLLNDLNKLNQQLEQRVTDQVGEIERMGRLRRFLPPQVADLIVASGTEKQLESHRREITALFCDLRGFTGFSESSDPEDVMALLAEYHAAIGKIIIKYSGTLERYAGDGVMVIFNDPVPVENPALQAVLMALDMRAAIGGLIEKWRDLGHDLGFGIGIAHGFATLGTIGFEGRRDYAAIGTVSNVASRLCDEAKPGQILIPPRVRQAIEKTVTVEAVGEFVLKGIRRPMMAYNVLEHSPSKTN